MPGVPATMSKSVWTTGSRGGLMYTSSFCARLGIAGCETSRIVLFTAAGPRRILLGLGLLGSLSSSLSSRARILASGVENLKWSVSGRVSDGGMSA